jgi:hypothetical protein
MKLGILVATLSVALAASAAGSPAAATEHVSIWGSYGVGFFLQGGPGLGDTNSHRLGGLSVTFGGERFRLRGMTGSLERTDLPIPHDNDADYRELDLVFTRKLTRLPFDLAFGPTRFDQNFPRGYPHEIGEPVRELQWGEHVSLIRDWDLGRYFALWGEASLQHVAFKEARETFLTLDLGLRARL